MRLPNLTKLHVHPCHYGVSSHPARRNGSVLTPSLISHPSRLAGWLENPRARGFRLDPLLPPLTSNPLFVGPPTRVVAHR